MTTCRKVSHTAAMFRLIWSSDWLVFGGVFYLPPYNPFFLARDWSKHVTSLGNTRRYPQNVFFPVFKLRFTLTIWQ